MDIHSQHESLNLENHQYQLEVLDQFSLNAPQVQAYRGLKTIVKEKAYEELVIWHNSQKDQDYESHNLQN